MGSPNVMELLYATGSPPNMLKLLRIVPWFIFLPVCAQRPDAATQAQATAHLHALLDAAPQHILNAVDFTVHPPADGWELGMVSSIAAAPSMSSSAATRPIL